MSAEGIPVLSVAARVSYPEFALDFVHDFRLAGVTALFGPSGAGKSTLAMARLRS